MIEATPLATLIGQELRRLRMADGYRQEDLAQTAQDFGLDWNRATVAAIETGKRGLSADELLLLPIVLRFRLRRAVELADLLPKGRGLVQMGDGTRIRLDDAHRILTGEASAIDLKRIDSPNMVARARALVEVWQVGVALRKEDVNYPWPNATEPEAEEAARSVSEAETKAAHKLGVSPWHVAMASFWRWGRSFTEERDRRVELKVTEDAASPARRQALRGHATRALIEELRPLFERSPSRKGKR